MRAESKASDKEQTPTLNRRLHDLRDIASRLKRSPMTPLQVCEAIIEKRLVDREVRKFFSGLPDDERHYWIASLYALLMPKARRRRLAAYFTPPHLAHYAIDVLIEAGIKPGQDRILDPASGGAAFLVPLAARIAAQGRQRGARAKTILQSINDTLHGVEIDAGLAKLSQALLTDLLDAEIDTSGIKLNGLIDRANTLGLGRPDSLYDAIIGNPPYGRILQPSGAMRQRFRPVISDGYVNLYALFVEVALQWVRPGGIICLIIPMSFVGGPYFAARGHVNASYERPIEDYDLRGLAGLLRQLPTLPPEGRQKKARLLWEALIELQDRRGQSVFSGSYSWQYHQWRSASFDSLFIRRLNESAWIPGVNGDLHAPSSILFDSLNWPADPFLLSKIQFKKPIVEELAREAGFEPGVLDILKKLGLTNTADLIARLNLDVPDSNSVGDESPVDDPPRATEAEAEPEDDTQTDEAAGRSNSDEPSSTVMSARSNGGDGSVQVNQKDPAEPRESSPGSSSPTSAPRSDREPGHRDFVSYVATHPEDADEGPDGPDHAERMALENRAIDLIRRREPVLKAMPAGNKGFDLIETDANDEPERWIEVKAMKDCLENRPVGLSNVQFEFARQHGEQYWLYVVEYAGDPARARIIKIQNPAGRTGTFTFDKGWISIADVDDTSSQ